jgi:hypothetical protein
MCEKPYYHLTVKAFTDPNNPDVAEWAWVTFKKVHGTIVAPGDDRIEHLIGAGIPHLFLAFVRGVAWRAAYRYALGPPGAYTFWEESFSDSVFATGQFIEQQPNIFSIKFTSSPIPLEDGSLLDPQAGTHIFNPIPVDGERLPERFFALAVNYIDPLVHVRLAPTRYVGNLDAWYATQYIGALNFVTVNDEFPEGEDEVFGQCLDCMVPVARMSLVVLGTTINCVYRVIRSSSREHPHWLLHYL